MSGLQKNAFTLKSLNDAINLRNHIIYLLERSDQLQPAASVHDKEMQNRLLTFVVLGGGFAGVEVIPSPVGVEVILNRRVIEATQDRIKLNDDTIILTNTIIWSAGVAPSMLTSNLTCDHDDKTRKIIVDKYLEVPKYQGVYAIGDCALVMDLIQAILIHLQHSMQ